MNSDIDNRHPDSTFLQLQQLGLIDANAIDSDTINTDAINIADKTNQTIKHELEDDSPWFIQIFFGFSGFLASLFFIGFLTLLLQNTGFLDSVMANFSIGMLLNLGGFVLFKSQITRRSMFLNSLAFTLSIAGQAYVFYSLVSGDIKHPFGIWLFLFIQSALTFIMANFMYRLLSSLVAFGCTVYLLNYYHLPEVSLGLLALIAIVSNLQRYRLLQLTSIKWRAAFFDTIRAVAYASALMLLCVSVYFIAAEYGNSFVTSDGYNEAFSYNYYLAQGLLTVASLYAAYLILRRYEVKLLSSASIIIFCVIIILGVMSIYVSGLLATSLIIIIAVANSQRVLLGLGIVALVSYIFWYYYQLDTSLLLKSASMLVIGITLLLIRWLIIKRYFADKTVDNTELTSLTMSASINQERLP